MSWISRDWLDRPEVYEGQYHAQYQFDDRVPESREAFGEITAFFDKPLGH
jgi:monoterpene epsilon-lactone hydrolase